MSVSQSPSRFPRPKKKKKTTTTNTHVGPKMEEGKKKHTIIIIITNNHLLHLPIPTHLAPKVLIKSIEMVLQLRGVHFVFGIVGRVLVEVGEQDRLAVRGLDVFSRTAVAVAAGANFVVEGAVDLFEGGKRVCE